MSLKVPSLNLFQFEGFDARSELFRNVAKAKKGPSGKKGGGGGAGDMAGFLGKVARVSAKTPEVMVRITGGASGKTHVQEHLAYITRNGQLEATNERGEAIEGRLTVRDVANEWSQNGPKVRNGRTAPDTRNLTLSMPVGTDPEKLLRAAKTFADKTFASSRPYLLALHTAETDPNGKTTQPHVHLTLKTRGFDGKNLHPKKADLQAWREAFAQELRAVGVAAEATPRRARGVVVKGKRAAVAHIEREAAQGKRAHPKVQMAKLQEAHKAVTGQEGPKVRPWELKIAERQTKVRGMWLATADALDTRKTPEAEQLAKQIRTFVAEMPPVRTERQLMEAHVRQHLQRDRGPER